VLGHRIFRIFVKDIETAGKRHAESAGDFRKLCPGFIAVVQVERRVLRQLIQYRAQLDFLVDVSEGMDAFLQAFGDG
jgi:hypothetical protein